MDVRFIFIDWNYPTNLLVILFGRDNTPDSSFSKICEFLKNKQSKCDNMAYFPYWNYHTNQLVKVSGPDNDSGSILISILTFILQIPKTQKKLWLAKQKKFQFWRTFQKQNVEFAQIQCIFSTIVKLVN